MSILLNKVANYDEPARHLLASIAYHIVCNHHEGLKIPLYAITLSMRGNTQTSKRHKLPRLPELLALPEFAALQEFLTDWQIDVTELQETIDQLVEQGQATMPIRLLNKLHLWITACLKSLRGWTRQIYEKL